MNRTVRIKRWGGAGDSAQESSRLLNIDRFTFAIDERELGRLQPGEKVSVTFTFEEPFILTPGLALFVAVGELEDNRDRPTWEELSGAERTKWERLARGDK